MIFSSLEFIFIFLPIFLILYFVTSAKYRNYILLIGSLIFYIVGAREHPYYIILLLFTILVNYIIGNKIEKTKSKKILIIGIIYNLIWLIVFKYLDFIIAIILDVSKIHIKQLNLLLPIGISFYTFQSISYLVDIYKGKYESEKSIIKYGMYVLMFPQLVSGPIVTYDNISRQLEKRSHNIQNIVRGVKYFIVGLGFKVLLANRIGCLWNDINMIGIESISTGLAWLGIIGYSLMAIGLGKIMGFKLPTNFKTPYLATSMTEFFRRWHITLGNWFKNYIYIPLGGNRKGRLRMIFNLFVVWILTGLWHGANYNFIIWGLFIFFIIVIEKLWIGRYLQKYKFLGHIYMLILIPITWSIFAITDIQQIQIMFSKLFIWNEGLYILDFVKYIKIYGILIIAGIVCATKLPEKIFLTKKNTILSTLLLALILASSIYYLYIGLNNPFLYFSF